MPTKSTAAPGRKKNERIVEVPQMDAYGHKQPQELSFEAAVLGALLIEQDAYSQVSSFLKPEMFYDHRHQLIFEAIQSLSVSQRPVDVLTLPQYMESQGTLEEAGGHYYIAKLAQDVITSAHIEYQAKILLQKYQARQLITYASRIVRDAFDETTDVADLMNYAEGRLFELSQQTQAKSYKQINVVVSQAIDQIRLAAQNKDGMSGLPSGFEKVDKMTNGWQNSDLIIIAARPAMGKTAFALSMLKNMAVDQRIPVAIFSLEMSNVQLANRLIQNVCDIRGDKIKSGRLEKYEWEQLDNRVNQLVDAPVFLDESSSLSIFELRTKARRLVREHGVRMIMIDYLQLMNASGMGFGNRQEEVSTVSRNLKALAKELNIPIIALSQLNRANESREGSLGKRPQLSDLRESGAIEQDADMVCFIHRPEYYALPDDSGQDMRGKAEIIIAKHRSGAVGTAILRFHAEFARFENLNSNYVPVPGEQTLMSTMNTSELEAMHAEAQKYNFIVPDGTSMNDDYLSALPQDTPLPY